MDSEVLRFFQQVADGATVTEVAELYRVSQPAVSRALARLEDEVGTGLLQRSGRVLRTTHAGSVFKRYVDVMLHALDDGLAAVEELVDPESGTVRVAFQLSLGTRLVPGYLATFREQHPLVQFHLEHSRDTRGPSPVAGGETDLEFTSRRPRDPDVRWVRLFRQPLRLAVPPGHALADRDEASLAEAAEEDFVMLRPKWELRTLSDELCAAAGFTPRVVLEADDIHVVRGLVAAGLGVAIVPTLPWEDRRPGAKAEPLVRLTDLAAFREVGLAWSESRRLLPSAELFRRHVLESRPLGVA